MLCFVTLDARAFKANKILAINSIEKVGFVEGIFVSILESLSIYCRFVCAFVFLCRCAVTINASISVFKILKNRIVVITFGHLKLISIPFILIIRWSFMCVWVRTQDRFIYLFIWFSFRNCTFIWYELKWARDTILSIRRLLFFFVSFVFSVFLAVLLRTFVVAAVCLFLHVFDTWDGVFECFFFVSYYSHHSNKLLADFFFIFFFMSKDLIRVCSFCAFGLRAHTVRCLSMFYSLGHFRLIIFV